MSTNMKLHTVFMSFITFGAASSLDLFAHRLHEELDNKAVIQFVYNTAATHNDVTANKSNTCFSSEYLRTASVVLSKMKPDVDPCHDFYQFACGTYIDQAQIPDGKGVITEFLLLSEKLQKQRKNIIEEERPAADPKYFKLPNALYKACMNTTLIESLGPKPMHRLAESLGGWPVIVGDSWNSNNSWNWQDSVAKSRDLGFSTNYMLTVAMSADAKNISKYNFYLYTPTLGLRHSHRDIPSLVLSYYDYMVDLAVLFGADREKAKTELHESLQFEKKLAYISRTYDRTKRVSVKQLQETYPYIQWLNYFNEFMPAGLNFDENEIINLSTPSYFYQLGKLLEATKKRTIANYMMWRLYEFSVPFLLEKFRNRKLQYSFQMFGSHKQKPRWKECEEIILDSSLKIALNSLYVHKYFKKESKEIVSEMIENIRNTYEKMIDQAQWLDDMTKYLAKKKLHSLNIQVGCTDELLDNGNMEKYYRELDIDSNKYFESYLKMNVFNTDSTFNKLRRSLTRHTLPMSTDVHYLESDNIIQFPAGIFQSLFFNRYRPMYMNYGAIGSIIGHELAHSFHDIDIRYDGEGNKIGRWPLKTDEAYLEKVKCIVDQYDNYTDIQTGLNLNGTNTLVENIADNAGIKQSYLAYKQWVKENGEELTLPGSNYTSRQVFWISSAQIQCSKYKKEYLESYMPHSNHSPYKFRVLGPFSNMKDFSRDFKCAEETRMNPLNKCELW